MHGGATIGRREHEDARLARAGSDGRTQVVRRGDEIRVRAQDAQARARHGAQAIASVVAEKVVFAVAEEGEVVVGHPAQQRGSLC